MIRGPTRSRMSPHPAHYHRYIAGDYGDGAAGHINNAGFTPGSPGVLMETKLKTLVQKLTTIHQKVQLHPLQRRLNFFLIENSASMDVVPHGNYYQGCTD